MYREIGIVKSFEGDRYNNTIVGYDEDIQQWYINSIPVPNQEVHSFHQYIQPNQIFKQSNKGNVLFLILGILGILITCFLSIMVGMANAMSASWQDGQSFMITMQVLAFFVPAGLSILFFILYFVSKNKKKADSNER